MFFQDAGSALFPWLVEENVRFGLRVRGVPRRRWSSIIDTYLGMVDLDRHRSKFPRNFPAACGSDCKSRAHSRSSGFC